MRNWGKRYKVSGPLRLGRRLRLQLEKVAPRRRKESVDAQYLRIHLRLTCCVAGGFIVSAAVSYQFLAGSAWHAYADTIGKYVIFLCLCFWIALVFEAALTWGAWSYKRVIEATNAKYGRERKKHG